MIAVMRVSPPRGGVLRAENRPLAGFLATGTTDMARVSAENLVRGLLAMTKQANIGAADVAS